MGVVVTGTLSTTDPSDTYPTHAASLGKGGASSVLTFYDLGAIPLARREFGMIVTGTNDGKSYILSNAIMGGVDNNLANNDNWQYLTIKSRVVIGIVSFANEQYKEVFLDDPLASYLDLPTLIIDAGGETEYLVTHGVQMLFKGTTPGVGFTIVIGAPAPITIDLVPAMFVFK
jgi:hypothetical protein